ncbi:MAG: alpha/beta hydrolase [Holophagaceae bacterium]|uniref:Alpha/beta hydrolase n=1 Tax=Candidatus Geothrix odensensis TaxID=2954440 RepID=A0A936F1B7_9BACT|nr:alpha/beta hydrolase [Candidatus Geothrix odensensis]
MPVSPSPFLWQRCCLVALCLAPALPLKSQPAAKVAVGFQVTVPATTPRDAALHVAGNMNGWNPGDPQWQLRRQADGTWSGQFLLEPGYALQFKLTRGSWETVEKDAKGGELPNRTVEVGPATTVRIQVASWRDQAPGAAVTHTVSGDLRLIEDFAMPQLATTRTLRILLPPGYETSGRRYPVLYMHDAQNLFDAATSFAGEWNVDETLTKLSASGELPAMIVVGIDHGGKERLAEYSPYRDERIPTAKGDAYADFLVQTLKPWVDRTYRTKPEATHTALAGSSLGGLISLHTALRHPGAFAKVACFSSSFWVGERQMLKEAAHAKPAPALRLYLDIGDREAGAPAHSRQAVQDTQDVATALQGRGLGAERLRVVVAPGARHTESAWAARFPAALRWLFQAAP